MLTFILGIEGGILIGWVDGKMGWTGKGKGKGKGRGCRWIGVILRGCGAFWRSFEMGGRMGRNMMGM